MAAPTITSVTPVNGATSIVLGSKITVTFDQVIDTTTFNESTFSLTGPGQTSIITPEQLIAQDPTAITGREFINGTFSFATIGSVTVATFTASKPLSPNQVYTVIVAGSSNTLVASYIKNLSGVGMVNSYTWSFTTGILNVTTPPVQSPIPDLTPDIDPTSVIVIPRVQTGNNLAQVILLRFPSAIDATSFDINDILLSITPIVGDPYVTVPPGLSATAVVSGRDVQVTITGW